MMLYTYWHIHISAYSLYLFTLVFAYVCACGSRYVVRTCLCVVAYCRHMLMCGCLLYVRTTLHTSKNPLRASVCLLTKLDVCVCVRVCVSMNTPMPVRIHEYPCVFVYKICLFIPARCVFVYKNTYVEPSTCAPYVPNNIDTWLRNIMMIYASKCSLCVTYIVYVCSLSSFTVCATIPMCIALLLWGGAGGCFGRALSGNMHVYIYIYTYHTYRHA